MSRGTFILTQDVSDLLRGFVQVQQAQTKTEAGFKRAAEGGKQSFRSLEQDIKRLERTSQQAAVQTVAGVRARVSGSALALSASQRSALSSATTSAVAGTDMSQLQQVAIQRRFLAQALRDQRSSDSLARRSAVTGARNSARIDWVLNRANAGLAAADQRYESRIVGEGASLANQAAIGFFAGGGKYAGDDRIMAQARKRVAKNIAATPELAGKVSDSEFDVMTHRTAEQISASRALMGKFAVGAAVVGAGLFSGVQKLVDDMTRARAKLDEAAAAIRGMQGLPGFSGQSTESLKKEGIELSNIYGVPLGQVLDLQKTVAIGGPNLDNETRKEISNQALLRQQLGGGSALDSAGIMDNLMDAYGNLSPKQAMNASEFLRTRGGMSVEDQTAFLPAILPTARMQGLAVEDVMALSSMTSETGGGNTQMAKAARAAIGKMPALQQKGIISGKGGMFGAFQDLDALRRTDPSGFDAAMEELGPSAGPLVNHIANNRDKFESARSDASKYLQSSPLADQMAATRRDPEGRIALVSGQLDEVAANAPAMRDAQTQQNELAYKRRKTALDVWAQPNSKDPDPARFLKTVIRAMGATPALALLPIGGPPVESFSTEVPANFDTNAFPPAMSGASNPYESQIIAQSMRDIERAANATAAAARTASNAATAPRAQPRTPGGMSGPQ